MTAVELGVDAKAPTGRNGGGKGGDAALDRFLADLCQALAAAEAGEEGVRLSTRRGGAYGEVARRFNALAQRQTALSRELARVARAAGREGRLTERVELDGAGGLWRTAAGSVNGLIDDLVRPTNEVARVISAVAEGDLSQKMALRMDGHPVKGEFQRIGRVVNSMVDHPRRLRRRGHPGGEGGRHRRPPGRPGRGAGRVRHLEGVTTRWSTPGVPRVSWSTSVPA